MVAIQRKLLHSVNSLIVVLISLLGFTTSCKDDEPVKYMYGTPHATFIVSGKVTSVADNQPIQDIIVEMRYVYPPINKDDSAQYVLGATSYSHGTGNYVVGGTTSPRDQIFKIRFVDTDGLLNGEYQTLDTTVVFKDPKFEKGDGSWFYGSVEKTLDVKLKPKE